MGAWSASHICGPFLRYDHLDSSSGKRMDVGQRIKNWDNRSYFVKKTLSLSTYANEKWCLCWYYRDQDIQPGGILYHRTPDKWAKSKGIVVPTGIWRKYDRHIEKNDELKKRREAAFEASLQLKQSLKLEASFCSLDVRSTTTLHNKQHHHQLHSISNDQMSEWDHGDDSASDLSNPSSIGAGGVPDIYYSKYQPPPPLPRSY